MAGKSAVISVLITGDAKGLKDAFGDAEKESGGFASKLGGTKAAMLGVAGAAIAGGAVLYSWAQGAAEDEQAAKILEKSLKDLTGATDDQVAAVEDWITQQGKTVGFADDELRPAFESMARASGSVEDAQRGVTLAMDIAAKTGKPLSTVTEALSKAYGGNTKALKLLDPALADVIGSAESTDEVMSALEGRFEGSAAAAADTAAGKWNIAKIQLAELQETIGYKVLPILAALVSFFVEKVIPAMESVVAWIEANWPKVQEVISNVATKVKEVIDVVWPHIQRIIEGVMTQIKGYIDLVMGLLTGDWSRAWEGIKGIFTGIWNQLAGIVGLAWEGVKRVLSIGVDWVKGKLNELVEDIKSIPGKISDAASGMFDGIKEAFKDAVNWIIRGWNRLEFKIPGFDPPGPGPSFGGFTLGVPDLPLLAAGGTAVRAGAAIVGEEGPELLHLPRGASVVPLKAAGDGGVTVNINAPVYGVDHLQRVVVDALQGAQRRGLVPRG